MGSGTIKESVVKLDRMACVLQETLPFEQQIPVLSCHFFVNFRLWGLIIDKDACCVICLSCFEISLSL